MEAAVAEACGVVRGAGFLVSFFFVVTNSNALARPDEIFFPFPSQWARSRAGESSKRSQIIHNIFELFLLRAAIGI